MSSKERLHQILGRWTQETPARLAAVDHDGRNISFAALSQEVEASERMLYGNGVRPGDRVMLVAENSVAHIALLLACSRLSAWAVPVNGRLTAAELGHIGNHARPRAMVFTHRASAEASSHAEAFGAVREGEEVSVLGNLAADPEPVFASADEQVAILIYTTGTMGAPKGVMVTHANSLHNMAVNIEIRGLSDKDHVYTAPPHTHIFALVATLASLRAGATVTFLPRFDPERTFSLFAAGVSVMPAVPAMYAKLLEFAERRGIKAPEAPRLHYISAGGAPLDPGWKRRVEAFFGLPLQNGYGLTEATPIVAATHHREHRADVAVGKAAPGVEIRIEADQDGVGEVLCRGPNVMKGYYRDPEATRAAIDDEGFLHTGDLGRLADDGSLTLVGRAKEVINVSGFNVYPSEVEAVLNSYAEVSQSAVVGNKTEDHDEEVLAFVECLPGADGKEAELKAYLSTRLAPYKLPRRIFVVEKLPAAPSGKLLKARMIETFAALIRDPNRAA